ncbi:MAG: hypothetical protein D6677_12810 [Calditrichaeota bacterium]|nr:MAG: hypothetical protein D6677_12810 [Calditrichota bacterium]
MPYQERDSTRTSSYVTVTIGRLTAIWALSESALGGILHGLKVPFTGMVVSAIAVFSIVLMIRTGALRSQLTKSLIIVAIVKAVVSPHSPPTAYLALFIQGGLALLFYQPLKKSLWAAYCLIFAAVMESALQKLIVLTLIFGRDLWLSIDIFANYLWTTLSGSGSELPVQAGMSIIVFYLTIHFLFALGMNLWMGHFLKNMAEKNPQSIYTLYDVSEKRLPRRKKWRISYLIYPLALLLLILTFVIPVFDSSVGLRVLRMLIRSTVILALWYGWLGPRVARGLQKMLRDRQYLYHDEIEQVLWQLPVLRRVFWQEWQRFNQAGRSGYRRFLENLLLILLFARIEEAASRN